MDTPDENTKFAPKSKINAKNKYDYNLNGLDHYRYTTVVNDFSYMLPTELAALHSENIQGLKKLQDIYKSDPNNYATSDIYNELAEYHNILRLSQSVLQENEKFIQREVKQLKDKINFEDEINEYLEKLSNEKKNIQELINKIKANKDMYAPTKSDYISHYNYNLKKLSFYESIYNEVLKRLKTFKGAYIEVLSEDNSASGEPDNVELANGVPANVEPANGVPANGVPASGNHNNGEPDYGVSASGEHASGGNRRRRIRNRKHTKITRRSRVIRTTRVIRKRKIY